MMKKIDRLFHNLNMSWPNVLLFSLAVGLFCGVFGGLPALHNTSFTDMAGGYEWWIIFAVIIAVNCQDYRDAGLKVGVFFLITQPLQFLIQAIIDSHNYANVINYFMMWLPVIVACFPGGMIAHYTKNQNLLGSIILGIGNTLELLMFIYYGHQLLSQAPRHLIATLISITSIVVMTLSLQKEKKYRLIAFIIPVVLAGVVVIYALANGLTI